MKTILAVTLSLVALLPGASGSDLLVYEGFDAGAGQSSGPLTGQAGATSTGFEAGSKWGVTESEGANVVDLVSEGLTCGNLSVVGGALKIGVNGPKAMAHAYRKFGVNAPSGAPLFGSFLFQNQQAERRYVAAFCVETQNSSIAESVTSDSHNFGDNAAPILFSIQPDSFNRDAMPSQGVKVRRSWTTDSIAAAGENAQLENGITYLVVWRISSTWDGSTTVKDQLVTMWILTAEQFAKVTANPDDISETGLYSNSSVTVEVKNGYRAKVQDTDFMNIAAMAAGGHGDNHSFFDEFRIGTSLKSVLPLK